MMRLEGKIAWISGATSGIGEAAARLFANEGAKVAIVGRSKIERKKLILRFNLPAANQWFQSVMCLSRIRSKAQYRKS